MVDEHELLVHISTSATRQNDQLFRSLADAYLDFEPYQRHVDSSLEHHVSSQPASTFQVSDPALPNQATSFPGNPDNSILSTGKDSYGSFPSHLSSDGQDEFLPPSSRLAHLEHIHQNWKAQATPKSSAVGRQRSTDDAPSSPEDADTAFIENTQDAAAALQSQMPDSFEMGLEDMDEDDEIGVGIQEVSLPSAEPVLQNQLEDSSSITWENSFEAADDAGIFTQEVSLSPAKPAEHATAIIAKESAPPRATASPKVSTAAVNRRKSMRLEEARGAAEAKTAVSSTPISSKPPPESSNVVPEHRRSLRSSNALNATASLKTPTAAVNRRKSMRLEEARTAEVKALVSSKTRLEFSSAVPEQQESGIENLHEADKLDQPTDFSELPFSVLAPEPKIGITRPGTLPSQITPYLATIKTQNPMRFKPIKKLHDPAPDTRGWWSLDCSEWPAQAQKDFWDALCKLLEDGSLGWATSLHREVGAQTLGEVRLYCWGELVEHMWLVLWLCSKGKVDGAGLEWFDAWKTAVFEME